MDKYIKDNVYAAVVAALLNCERTADAIKTALGEIGGIWPEWIAPPCEVRALTRRQ